MGTLGTAMGADPQVSDPHKVSLSTQTDSHTSEVYTWTQSAPWAWTQSIRGGHLDIKLAVILLIFHLAF